MRITWEYGGNVSWVEVRLSPRGSSYDVERVRPVAWRAPSAPPRRAELGAVMGEIVDAVRDRRVVLRGGDDESFVVAIEPESYQPQRSIVFAGAVFVQMAVEMEPVASISAFAADAFARECPDLAQHWPALIGDLTVFRFEPREFGEAAGYVVAHSVRLA